MHFIVVSLALNKDCQIVDARRPESERCFCTLILNCYEPQRIVSVNGNGTETIDSLYCTGERYLQDDADEAADENGKQSSAQEWTVAIAGKGEEGVMTGSSNASIALLS
ncbi:hypothetical protein SDJN03_20540, partial [Cucurbita argyrosperma subsp. sororia]